MDLNKASSTRVVQIGYCQPFQPTAVMKNKFDLMSLFQ